MHILLVEDDEILGDGIRAWLTQTQHATVDWVKDGAAAWSIIQAERFALVILDINLPKLSGDEILENMRAKNITTPVIILTAYDSIEGRIKRFALGADDYLTKPFSIEELCARMRAVLRRTWSNPVTNDTIKVGDIALDPATGLVFKSGQMMEISRREFTLLQLLMENVGKVVPQEQVTQTLYGYGYCIDSKTLEACIHSLRKKLRYKNIRTVRGIGYVLEGTSSS